MKAHLILPHGVLFRGQKEGYCRKRILELNWLASIVGVPENMFLDTSIPVAVLTLGHDKPENGVLIIDASKGFEKVGKQNVMTPEHISKIVDAVRARSYVDKFANVASFEEIKENDYNLNIPRYVDTFEHELLRRTTRGQSTLCRYHSECLHGFTTLFIHEYSRQCGGI